MLTNTTHMTKIQKNCNIWVDHYWTYCYNIHFSFFYIFLAMFFPPHYWLNVLVVEAYYESMLSLYFAVKSSRMKIFSTYSYDSLFFIKLGCLNNPFILKMYFFPLMKYCFLAWSDPYNCSLFSWHFSLLIFSLLWFFCVILLLNAFVH